MVNGVTHFNGEFKQAGEEEGDGRPRRRACWTICCFGLGTHITREVLLRTAANGLITIIIGIIIRAQESRHLESNVPMAPSNRSV